MSKWFAVLVLLVALLLPAHAMAQNAIGFDSLDVSVWPEYDTPTVLVIYKISLTADTTFPAEINLKIPANVEKMSAVAIGTTADGVSDTGVEYKFTPGTDFSQLSLKAQARFIQVEYYDPGLNKTGSQHQYKFDWQSNFGINNFRFEFRQPLQSSKVSVVPALTPTILDADGFQFSEYKQTDVKVGQKIEFNINYERSTDSPSTSFLKVQSSTPLDQTLPGQSNWTIYLPWVLGGLGLALLFVAGWVYWTSGRTNRAAAASRKRHAARGETISSDSDGQQVHCSQCGKRTQPGDRFCRACGARIRRVE